MEATSRRQALLKAIHQRLEVAYEDTLEDVIELLDIRKAEDLEDIKAVKEKILNPDTATISTPVAITVSSN